MNEALGGKPPGAFLLPGFVILRRSVVYIAEGPIRLTAFAQGRSADLAFPTRFSSVISLISVQGLHLIKRKRMTFTGIPKTRLQYCYHPLV